MNVIQSAMLYLAMLLAALGQLCVQLFHAVASLDWPLILERIGGAYMLVATTILDCLSVVFYATVYILGGLLAALSKLMVLVFSVLVYTLNCISVVLVYTLNGISSVLVYTLNGFLSLAQSAFHSVQLWFGDKQLLSEETYMILLLAGLIILAIFLVYNLAIGCIRRHLRWKARKRRRQLEANAQQRRQLVNIDAVPLPDVELRDNSIRRRNHRETDRANAAPRIRERIPSEGRRAQAASREVGVDNWNALLEKQSLTFYRKPSHKGTKSAVTLDDKRVSANISDESTSDPVVHTRMQELERELLLEKESKQCVVCMDRTRVMMIRPCNHYCICEECSKQLSRCPICTKHSSRMEKVFNV